MTQDKAELIAEAAARAVAYVEGGPGPVAPPPAALAALDGFDPALPDGPTDPRLVLDLLDRLGSPATVRSTGGRYFGFVTGGTEPAGLAAGILAAAWDQNGALPVMSPIAARLDAIAARWVTDLLGLGPTVEAAFCAGATVANLTAILAARDTLLAREGWDVGIRGLAASPPIEVVTGAEVHASVLKALRLAGIGTDAVHLVPTDDRGRLRAEALPPVGPRTLIVAQAGNVNTGHSDPFPEIVEHARCSDAWVHVDGAFGLWAAATPAKRHLVAGVGGADSWATDGHKWLNATYDAGIVACARGEDLRRAMTVGAAYLPAGGERIPMNLGIQMSQRARGTETWAILAALGRSGLAALVDTTCALAARFAERLAAGGAEIPCPVALNQVLARFDDDETTAAVIEAVQRDGTCWVGGTTWQGRHAMRISVSDAATTAADVDASTDAILRCHRALAR